MPALQPPDNRSQRASNGVRSEASGSEEGSPAGRHRPCEGQQGRWQPLQGPQPSFTKPQLAPVRYLLTQGKGISAIADETGLSRQAIYRIKDDPAGAERALTEWSLGGPKCSR
jgi:putative DNA-invertase from lambdoid prophage Rac